MNKTGFLFFLSFSLMTTNCHRENEMSNRKTSEKEWQEIKQNAQFIVHGEFGSPINPGSPVNTSGWEDSPNISADGKTLLFAYVNWDMLESMEKGVMIVSGPVRGFDSPEADAFISSFQAGSGNWTLPIMLPFCTKEYGEVGPQLSYDGSRIYFSSDDSSEFGPNDIWMSEWANGTWQSKINLGSPPNSNYYEEDPALSVNEDELFFWSNDLPGGLGDADIWVSIKTGITWEAPINLGSPINTPYTEMQPFLTWDGQWLYFTSNRDGVPAIYRSKRDTNDIWQPPEAVIEAVPESGVFGVGEPTLTADGNYLYFIAGYKSAYNEYDADILYVESVQ